MACGERRLYDYTMFQCCREKALNNKNIYSIGVVEIFVT